jgi:hypothetical protein
VRILDRHGDGREYNCTVARGCAGPSAPADAHRQSKPEDPHLQEAEDHSYCNTIN